MKNNGDTNDLTQGSEMYSPITNQAWGALLNLMGFFYQFFSQIIGSFAHFPLLSFSSYKSFKSLPNLDHDSDLQIASDADNRPLQKFTVCCHPFTFHYFILYAIILLPSIILFLNTFFKLGIKLEFYVQCFVMVHTAVLD